jgi:hypothetical protein
MQGDKQLSCYLTRELKIRLYEELARREMGFSDWVRQQAKAWLAQQAPSPAGDDQPVA